MKETVAIVGTRNPCTKTSELCTIVSTIMCKLGFGLVTGNAEGVDSIATSIWNKLYPERITLVLPWHSYNKNFIHPKNNLVVFDGLSHKE